MMTLSILALILNSPWYIAWEIERLTGIYPEWIVDVFGGISHGILEGYECFISLF
ncbi:MAG: hypothetical protein IJE74_01310 [Clostridia bacterium]|nr:hypothetical protein [Clostridia bacterium]